jgi:hypothetical protein
VLGAKGSHPRLNTCGQVAPDANGIDGHLLGLCRDLDAMADELQTDLIAIKLAMGTKRPSN